MIFMELVDKILENGKEYSVKQLFSTDHRKIIIPDFQRDYCWGDKHYGENHDTDIVSSFIQTLIEEQINGDIVLGKIDVYQNPKNHIYLTDGQQRLTTIYLLLGMLARKSSFLRKEDLKNCLISEYEEKDDKEPYLQYSIRESSLFFLRDLVNEFFIKENKFPAKDIEKQSWYFKEYDLDPTIQSMLRALNIIETEINKINELDVFSSFVLNNIKIQYYDVVDRKHGEERFVIINTTGKQLSVSENIKPILLGKIKDTSFATKWEERETYFWKNRNKEKNEFTSDKGVADFMIWCFQILGKQETIDLVKVSKEALKKSNETNVLNRINTLFNAVQKLTSLLKTEAIQKQFKFVNNNKEVKTCLDLRSLPKEVLLNVLLPLICFIDEISDNENDVNQFVRRLRKNLFDNKWKERNSNYIDWRYILQIIEESDSLEKCLLFSNLEEIGSVKFPVTKWYNEEEKMKTILKKENQSIIEEMEDHKDFMGDISPIFEVCENSNKIQILKSYYITYKKIRIEDFNFSEDIELENIYRLHSYLVNGNFEHRTIKGYGYFMLVESKKIDFQLYNFSQFWRLFNNADSSKIKDEFVNSTRHFIKHNAIGDKAIDSIFENFNVLDHYPRVWIWALIEFLYSGKSKPIDYSKSIACYWGFPNCKIINDSNIYQNNNFDIENTMLGYSYKNNKMGDFYYDSYFYMKNLKTNNIKDFNLREKLKSFLTE